jgi:hypothetical protein
MRESAWPGAEGYEFSTLGDFEANVWDLKVLYDRVTKGLAVRQRGARGAWLADHGRTSSRSRITWDPDRAGKVPLLVIDGRPFT